MEGGRDIERGRKERGRGYIFNVATKDSRFSIHVHVLPCMYIHVYTGTVYEYSMYTCK